MATRDDKTVERERYDRGAMRLLDVDSPGNGSHHLGAASIVPTLRPPYTLYEQRISALARPEHHVLELGAGAGMHTGALLSTGARVIACDISPYSLALLKRRLATSSGGRLHVQPADMEVLPFDDSSFDIVTSAGSLSYGDPELVDAEVQRVLKPGGAFICVDSLNHSPIYRLNRWLRYRLGQRTRSTLLRMPTLARIEAISANFESVEVRFFGSVTWAMPVLVPLIGADRAVSLSDFCDRLIDVKRSAFKFVLVGKGVRPLQPGHHFTGLTATDATN